MHESRNIFLAILLSALVWISWQYFIAMPRHQAEIREQAQAQADKPSVAAEKGAAPIAAPGEILKERGAAISEAPRIPIKNADLSGSLSLKGARFDDLSLARYKETMDKNSPEVVLLSPSDTESFYFGEFGWIAGNSGIKVPDSSTIWKADGNKLEPGKPLTLSWTNPQGVTFKQAISLDDNYMFTVKQSVENKTGALLELMPYGLINRVHRKGKSYYVLHEGPIGVVNNTLKEITYQKLTDEKKIEYKDAHGWMGITDKYWLTAMIPGQGETFDSHLTYSKKDNIDRFQVDYLGARQSVNPGQTKEISTYFFAGAKEVKLLDNYSEKLNITLFDRAIDFGWFYFLTKRMFYLLSFINSHVGNFGVAIILLTFLVKLLMFPLANKSYKSMGQMKALQPQIMKLRERYKDDKMKLNQEVMQLYKREKVNPLSGCLPLFVQIPIFFSLYKVLFVTIEMRHAPFFGWIHDLSAPDPTSVFNLFGLLPFHPPAFLMIGVLPLLYGSSMLLLQRFNPAPADPAQAQMMKMLPIVFTFLFASFPAGLVLYWVCSNILSILQQWVITREILKKKPRK